MIKKWMHHRGITLKDLVLCTAAFVPLVFFTVVLIIGLVGSLLQ